MISRCSTRTIPTISTPSSRFTKPNPYALDGRGEDYEHYFNLHKMSTLLAHENGRIVAYLFTDAREEQAGLRGGRR